MAAAASSSSSAGFNPQAKLQEEDLFCPIFFDVMKKVATLNPCGHSFNQPNLLRWFATRPIPKCPFCNQNASVLPSDEELKRLPSDESVKKMVQLAARRSALQEACDQYHKKQLEAALPKPSTPQRISQLLRGAAQITLTVLGIALIWRSGPSQHVGIYTTPHQICEEIGRGLPLDIVGIPNATYSMASMFDVKLTCEFGALNKMTWNSYLISNNSADLITSWDKSRLENFKQFGGYYIDPVFRRLRVETKIEQIGDPGFDNCLAIQTYRKFKPTLEPIKENDADCLDEGSCSNSHGPFSQLITTPPRCLPCEGKGNTVQPHGRGWLDLVCPYQRKKLI